jgi:hypothetical protein
MSYAESSAWSDLQNGALTSNAPTPPSCCAFLCTTVAAIYLSCPNIDTTRDAALFAQKNALAV